MRATARVTFLEPSSASKPERQDQRLFVIPKLAVLQRESGNAVYVVVDEKVQAKPIVVQKEVGGDVFVSAGLVGNEAIIVTEQLSQLKIGDRVQVK